MTREKTYMLLEKLLEAEKQAGTLGLTDTEMLQLAKNVKDAFTEPCGMISTKVPEGELRAYIGTDPDCPSICIMLEPEGADYEIDMALTEHCPGKGLRTNVYGVATDEDYTYSEVHSGLAELKEYMEAGDTKG